MARYSERYAAKAMILEQVVVEAEKVIQAVRGVLSIRDQETQLEELERILDLAKSSEDRQVEWLRESSRKVRPADKRPIGEIVDEAVRRARDAGLRLEVTRSTADKPSYQVYRGKIFLGKTTNPHHLLTRIKRFAECQNTTRYSKAGPLI